ncbi:MAG TPA: hypothetical protein VG733_06350, partial [Chthoniobacteraceae bacterium]|nr:hypothetical protein [Chthoniobacteraceae bacterium]
MRYFHPNIERHMRKTEGRWKALRFLQHTGVIGAITSLAALALGVAILRGWVENPYTALGLLVAFCVAGALAWVVAAVIQAGRGKPRPWLAGHLEKAYNPLLDRINTLVFLGAKKPDAATQSYAKRIEAQASQLLAKAQPPNPFRATRPLLHLGVFVALLCCTVWFYNRYSPIAKLMEAWKERQLLAKQDDPARAFKLPDADASEEKKPWSEVRITDPDGDIKATKVDVVPLEIEAASNQSLNNVGWALNVNGGAEQPRPLDPPAEPHYAVYQPTLALDELRLSDWDVVSYYAKASTDGGGNSSSDLYFIEIRPFREDLMKMPGGEGGKAASEMGEMTTLIDRQRTILRQTHRYDQQPNPDAKVREQDRKKLQDAESELGDSVNQYYAKMAADFENQPIADTLDHLAMAGTHIGHAVGALRNDMAPQAVTDEQSALTELAATRKDFSKFVTEHPEAFPGGGGEKPDEQKPFTASDQLDKIAEFRDT